METYSFEANERALGIDADLEATIEARAAELASLIVGQRHVEAFVADVSLSAPGGGLG
jgi:hypothetical protein